LIPKEDLKAHPGAGPSVGVDLGASLAKLAVKRPGGGIELALSPAREIDDLLERLAALAPASIGLTGCGAAELDSRLEAPVHRVVEFEAWAHGADRLLERAGGAIEDPYLLVSLGTGTSVLRVEAGRAQRLGGTALGGGTVLGLGAALTGCESHEELCQLARGGRRGNVDLLVSDLYREGEIPLPGETTAAAFGNLARWLVPDAGTADRGDDSQGPPLSNASNAEQEGAATRREDLALAVMGLIAENVALICGGLASAAGIGRIVYGGATLIHNPSLCDILLGVSSALGHRPSLLEDGGFAGAVGALELARLDTPDPA